MKHNLRNHTSHKLCFEWNSLGGCIEYTELLKERSMPLKHGNNHPQLTEGRTLLSREWSSQQQDVGGSRLASDLDWFIQTCRNTVVLKRLKTEVRNTDNIASRISKLIASRPSKLYCVCIGIWHLVHTFGSRAAKWEVDFKHCEMCTCILR